MGISTQRVKLDIGKQASMQVIRLGQGDRNGTTLVAELYDGGSPYSLSGKTARFTMRTPDGRSSYSVNSSSTSNNTATFNIDERYAAGVAGTTDVAYIEVLSGSTVICSTSRMRVICLQSATEGVSPSQMHDNGLDAAIAAANTAASSANTAASNANTKASRAETATTNANTARDNANTAASAANTAASAATTAAGSASTAAEAANNAKDAANAAATAANTAAGSANAATSEANAAIEAIGDISELAVPEMTASVRGGAKVGGSTQVIGGKLEVKLSESATGTSVTTGSTSALRALEVHGKSVQDGTPTPDAPVPVQVVEGRNLLDWKDIPTRTYNGVTWESNGDGWIRATGTASGGYSYGLVNPTVQTLALGYIAYCEPGTYTASGDVAFNVYAMGPDASGTALRAYSTNSYTFTLTEPKYIQLGPRVTDGTATNTIYHLQLEKGSIATPYTPYGSIGIVVGDTVTTINLQGNTLASLPDGTHDELHVDSAGHCVLTKNVGKTTINDSLAFGNSFKDSSTMGGNCTRITMNMSNFQTMKSAALNATNSYMSIAMAGSTSASETPYPGFYSKTATSGVYLTLPPEITSAADVTVWLTVNNFDFFYPLATPETIDLGYIDPPAIPSGSVVTVSASLTPTFDLDCWTEHASELADIPDAITTLAEVIYDKQESIASSIAPVEGSTASANHAVDDYLMLGARLYRVTTAIASGELIIPGTNVTETTVMAEIVSLLS